MIVTFLPPAGAVFPFILHNAACGRQTSNRSLRCCSAQPPEPPKPGCREGGRDPAASALCRWRATTDRVRLRGVRVRPRRQQLGGAAAAGSTPPWSLFLCATRLDGWHCRGEWLWEVDAAENAVPLL